ncbi:hypothetical protein ACMZ4X_05538 [Achromobacter marplatensis]
MQQVRFAQEVRDEQGARAEVKVGRRAQLFDRAAVHQADAVGHGHGLFLVVRHVHDGGAQLAVDAFDLKLHLVAQLFVQRAQRFVHQDDGRAVDHATRQRDALLLAAGEFARQTRGDVRQAHHFQRFVGAAAGLGGRHLAHLQGERDVLLDAHVRKQRIVLEHHADIPFVWRAVGDIGAVDQHAALVGLRQAGDQAQQGGFAGPGRTQQGQELAASDVQVRGRQGDEVAVAFAQARDLQIGRRHGVHSEENYFRTQPLKRSSTSRCLSSQYAALMCRPVLMLSGWVGQLRATSALM